MILCAACECHVRVDETRCPHCGAIAHVDTPRRRGAASVILGLTIANAMELACSPAYGSAPGTPENDPCAVSEDASPPPEDCAPTCERTSDCEQSADRVEVCSPVGDRSACLPAQPCQLECADGFVCRACPTCAGGCSGQRWCFPDATEAYITCSELQPDAGP